MGRPNKYNQHGKGHNANKGRSASAERREGEKKAAALAAKQQADAELAAALAASKEEAEVRAAVAAVEEAEAVAVAEEVDDTPPLPVHTRTLLLSLCALLTEQSILDKAALTEHNSTLLALAEAAESWIDWEAEDARVAAETEAEAQRVAEWPAILASLQEAANVEAASSGKAPGPEPKFVANPPAPITSAIALQLKDSPAGTRFVHFLLEECLIAPDPETHENKAKALMPLARRMCFTLLEVMCRHNAANLRVVLDWVQEYHGTGKMNRAAEAQAEVEAGTASPQTKALIDLGEDSWDIDPSDSERSDTGFVGLKNQAATCYQNSLLQQLFHAPVFRKELMSMRDEFESESKEAEDEDEKQPTLLQRIQTIFYYLSHSQRKFFDPIGFVKSFAGVDGQPINPREQQDVVEFCNLLFERLENNLEGAVSESSESSPGPRNLMKKYFCGSQQDERMCEEYAVDPSHKRSNVIPFYVLSLDIVECKSLQQCLEKFVQSEIIDGVNCDKCGRKRQTKKRCIIHTWPRLVIFHLNRFRFDMELMKTKKINDEVSFPLEIDLEPYTEAGMERRDAAEKLAAEAKAADEAAGKPPGAESHEVTDTDPSIFLPCSFEQCNRASLRHCVACEAYFCPVHDAETHSAQSFASPDDPTKMYRLVGVVVHSGHAEGGHYYSYIRSRINPAEWHEFNDTAITEFDPDNLAKECFGGMEDPEAADKMTEVVNKKGKKKKTGEEWQTGKVERSRNAYLLWYELCDLEAETESMASAMNEMVLSPKALISTPIESLPAHLQSLHQRIIAENALQLKNEIFLESTYLDMIFKVARSNVDFLGPQKQESGDEVEEKSSVAQSAAAASSGLKYLNDIEAELDRSDLTVLYIQSLTLFVLDTAARVKESPRFEVWCHVLQHAYNAHIGCCQWLLEMFILRPADLTEYLLECKSADTRKSICSLFELAVKKLIVFELDEDFVETFHVILPVLKEQQKRVDAQAGLAAALSGDAAPAANVAAAAAASAASSASSPGSFLSSALAQGAAVEAQLAPVGLFKPTAKSTVAVSARLAVLEGVGKGTEKQFGANGVRTLQQLVEITPAQREAIDKAPTGGMTQVQLQGWVDQAQRAVDFILELSGVTEIVAAEQRKKDERAAAKKAANGANFPGPRMIPAFLRTCLQTLEAIVTSVGRDEHTCPELCQMLVRLAQCHPALMATLLELGAVDTCIDVVVAPVTLVMKAREEKALQAIIDGDEAAEKAGQTKAEYAAARAAEEEEARAKKELRKQKKKERMSKASGKDSKTEDKKPSADKAKDKPSESKSDDADESKSDDDGEGDKKKDKKKAADEDSDDEGEDDLTDLEDLGYVDLLALIDVMVRACTTRSGRPGEVIQLLPNTLLKQETLDRLRTTPFVTRLVLQISAAKPDPAANLAVHLAWENMEFTDILLNEIFSTIHSHDFFDFYACIKILQHVLNLKDSAHQYRVELAMPRLLQLASEFQIFYKATEMCIKSFIHIAQHVPAAASWLKVHEAETKWIDTWLGRNRSMPKKTKDGSQPDGVCLYTVKGKKNEGVTAKWEKNWIDQIAEYGVGQGESDNLSDYQKIWRKLLLSVKVRAASAR